MARTRRNFNLAAERAALIRSLKNAETNWYAMCRDFRDAGQYWLNIKTELQERKITAGKWASESAPVSKRWLDKYAEFAARWNEFQVCWKWSQRQSYAPERRPGLWGCFDLMDAKKRFDTYSKAQKRVHQGEGGLGTVVPNPGTERHQGTAGKPIRLTATATLLHGDVTDIMRKHISDGSVDLAIADVPYFLRGAEEPTVTDFYIQKNGMKPLFNEAWDRFDSIEQYEAFCIGWMDEALRCLDTEGSLFVFGTFHNIGLINRICQMKKYGIVNEIVWLQRNGRPNVATRRLQASHQNILWIAKDDRRYRFNYRLCKRSDYDDWLSKLKSTVEGCLGHSGQQPREQSLSASVAKAARRLSKKILDVAGRSGGLLLDLFSGSGTGAVAASEWGMRSVSIEREAAYVQMIRQRVAAKAQQS